MKIRNFSGSCVAVAALILLPGSQILCAQETREKVTVDEVDRAYTVRLPQGYDSQRRYPVVVLLHGMNQDPDDMERLTRFDELADKDGIIAVYPAALHGRWNPGVRAPEHRQMAMGPGRRGTLRRRLSRGWGRLPGRRRRISRWRGAAATEARSE